MSQDCMWYLRIHYPQSRLHNFRFPIFNYSPAWNVESLPNAISSNPCPARSYRPPRSIRLGHGRYALIGHHSNTVPMPPRMRPLPSHKSQSGHFFTTFNVDSPDIAPDVVVVVDPPVFPSPPPLLTADPSSSAAKRIGVLCCLCCSSSRCTAEAPEGEDNEWLWNAEMVDNEAARSSKKSDGMIFVMDMGYGMKK